MPIDTTPLDETSDLVDPPADGVRRTVSSAWKPNESYAECRSDFGGGLGTFREALGQ
jgi:hypothetical protein